MSDQRVTECPHGEPYGAAFACPACQSDRRDRLEHRVRTFRARFPGRCESGDPIEPGDLIVGDGDGGGCYWHLDCM